MAAMKPRTGDGPMEAEREPRGLIVLRVPLEGGGRLVVSINDTEALVFATPEDKKEEASGHGHSHGPGGHSH